MCVIITHAGDGTAALSDADFSRAWLANPDGAGLAYWGADGLCIVRELMDERQALDAYRRAMDARRGPLMLHFRIGTHGARQAPANTHPFAVARGKVAMAHNGILPADMHPEPGDQRSDTALFAAHLADWEAADLLSARRMRSLADYAIGNRLAFLGSVDGGRKGGRLVLVGDWQDVPGLSGTRASNLSWQWERVTYSGGFRWSDFSGQIKLLPRGPSTRATPSLTAAGWKLRRRSGRPEPREALTIAEDAARRAADKLARRRGLPREIVELLGQLTVTRLARQYARAELADLTGCSDPTASDEAAILSGSVRAHDRDERDVLRTLASILSGTDTARLRALWRRSLRAAGKAR